MTRKEEKSGLTAEWLRENLIYVPETGAFLWKKAGRGRVLDRVLGTTVWPGYLVLKLNGGVYYAHRVAWFYVHGEWPAKSVDHIDGQKANNAISNLRLATSAQNAARRKVNSMVSPSRGVFPHGAGFVARIHFAGKRHYLGYFSKLEDARAAYEAKAKEVHGEFAFPPHGGEAKIKAGCCDCCGAKSDQLKGDWGHPGIGPKRGKLCMDCWVFVQTVISSDEMHRIAKLVISYLRKFE